MSGPREPDPSSHFGFLDEAEEKTSKKARRRQNPEDEESLDLDKIW